MFRTLRAYLLGMIEFRTDFTTSFDDYDELCAYDAGRDRAHALTLRRYDDPGACPLCGNRYQAPHPAHDTLLVCAGCSETLQPSELVPRATRATRTAYYAANPAGGGE